MTRAREITLMLLTAAIIFFAYENRDPVPVFFFREFRVSAALIALVPLLTGIVIGAFATAIAMRKRRRAAESEPDLEDDAVSPPEDEVEYEPADDDEAAGEL